MLKKTDLETLVKFHNPNQNFPSWWRGDGQDSGTEFLAPAEIQWHSHTLHKWELDIAH